MGYDASKDEVAAARRDRSRARANYVEKNKYGHEGPLGMDRTKARYALDSAKNRLRELKKYHGSKQHHKDMGMDE